MGPVDYKIDMTDKRKRYWVFHVNMLREWHSPKEEVSFLAEVDKGEDEEDLPSIEVESGECGWKNVGRGEHLNQTQQSQLESLLDEYSTLCSDQPGHTTCIEHKIDTGTAPPIRQGQHHRFDSDHIECLGPRRLSSRQSWKGCWVLA